MGLANHARNTLKPLIMVWMSVDVTMAITERLLITEALLAPVSLNFGAVLPPLTTNVYRTSVGPSEPLCNLRGSIQRDFIVEPAGLLGRKNRHKIQGKM